MPPNSEFTEDAAVSPPEKWLDEYGDYLYRYALSRVSSHSTSEDLVQETIIAGIRCRDKFAGRSTLKSWLTGILKMKILDHFRKLAREVSLSEEEYQNDVHQDWFDKHGHWNRELDVAGMLWEPDPSEVLEQKEFWDTLQSCLKRLPPKAAIAFTQREMEYLSTGDIRDSLGVSESNLWVLLHRARNQLRRCLKANWIDPHNKTQP